MTGRSVLQAEICGYKCGRICLHVISQGSEQRTFKRAKHACCSTEPLTFRVHFNSCVGNPDM